MLETTGTQGRASVVRDRRSLNVGLVGAGFMGRAHCVGFSTAERIFDLPIGFNLHSVADTVADQRDGAQQAFGFRTSTSDWRSLVDDPEIDVVDIATPNTLHREIALAAAANGKHVYCEKPLAPNAKAALEMAEAAESAGVVTQVGFNYLANPMISTAREMIAAGELGEIHSYRGVHAEDYMSDPHAPWSFRLDPEGGGALADIGSHAIATAEFLLGPIGSVLGDCRTVIDTRRGPDGSDHKSPVDDVSVALVRFTSGVTGTLEANWVATGRKMQHDFEVFGSRGSLRFSQERLNELHFYTTDDRDGRQGFRRIDAGPFHGEYSSFCTAPGHQIGFNDLKAIEFLGFSEALAGTRDEPFSFRMGARIESIVDAILRSSRTRSWQDIGALNAASAGGG